MTATPKIDRLADIDFSIEALLANRKTNPTTLVEIRQSAECMWADPAVVSVNIIASFGEVTVHRNGQICMA